MAERIGAEVSDLVPSPPGLRVFDAGMGDASVLAGLMRQMHQVFPRIPWTVVGKEISLEDVRQALWRLPDRFFEHPEMVFVVTNMRFEEAVRLQPADSSRLVWRELALEGQTSHEFAAQMRELLPDLAETWKVETSPRTGNPVYVHPTVVVIWRADHEFLLRQLIPRPGDATFSYDLMVAAQAYRAATPVEQKVRTVVAPLARGLAPGGRLVGIHARGDDPGMEIITGVWPGERPFPHGREEILAEARRQLSEEELEFLVPAEDDLVRYQMHTMPSEAAEHIGTSSIMATWNAAVYVAQIDEERLTEAMRSGVWEVATRSVMERHSTVWFEDEVYLITRPR